MQRLTIGALFLALVATGVHAQINAGEQKPDPGLPFTMTQVVSFGLPWRLAFLPDGRMLITEKVGPIWLVTPAGAKTALTNVPAVMYGGQGGMLGVYVSPTHATDRRVYLTYSEPDGAGASGLALARAQLSIAQNGAASLWIRGAVAPDAQGPGRAVRRRDRLFT
jgi:glucose/arabinose dehydrogenase